MTYDTASASAYVRTGKATIPRISGESKTDGDGSDGDDGDDGDDAAAERGSAADFARVADAVVTAATLHPGAQHLTSRPSQSPTSLANAQSTRRRSRNL